MTTGNCPVSIIIPTWNRCGDLRHTLQKLREMRFPEFHVHVYVNGCTDGTLEMLNKEFPVVKVHFSLKNDGPPLARNAMIQACSTEYVVGLDNDSWPLDVGFSQCVVDAFERWPDAAFLAGCVHDKQYPSGPRESVEEEFPVRSFVCCAWAARRERFLELGGFRPYFTYGNEESELTLRARVKGWLAVYVSSFRVYHANVAKSRDLYFNHRDGLCNCFSSSFLNEPAWLCVLHLGVLTWKGLIFCFQQGHFIVPFLAWGDFLKRLPRLLGDRCPARYATWRAWQKTRGCPPG